MMKLNKTASVEELQVISRFESLRKILLSEQYADHLKKPLAYWALPTDRRLPLAFLGRTLEDLLADAVLRTVQHAGDRPEKNVLFCEVAGAGGQHRPLRTAYRPDELSQEGVRQQRRRGAGRRLQPRPRSPKSSGASGGASVLKHGLGDEKLGRFAPSLRNMTRVIWNTPLEFYTKYNLGEIRSMKTHGEKRVRAILEVFHSLHVLVANMGTQEDLVVRIVPRLIDRVEQWIGQALQTPGVPGPGEIFEHFVSPLLEQVRTDATQQIASLAENRLGISAPITSVRQAARAMGLTRARVYQLLNEINDIMTVRWPLGRHQVYELREKFQTEARQMDPPPDLEQFLAAVELFYPGSRRGAAGPLEHAQLEDEAENQQEEFEDEEAEHLVGDN